MPKEACFIFGECNSGAGKVATLVSESNRQSFAAMRVEKGR
ncbi:hypothetical protein [Flexithrix dorotheae]|nr:hypothetical protein [Flexithrix dorotheae]